MSAERLHLIIEALEVFADAHRYIADPEHEAVPVDELLSKEYAARRRALISPTKALTDVEADAPNLQSGTVYLCTADADGRMVSVHPVQLHGLRLGRRRSGHRHPPCKTVAHGFTLEEGHPNRVGPGKRPFHTIIPGFITKDEVPLAAFGVGLGGDMQPQGHVHTLLGIVDHGLNPQSVFDAPRVRLPRRIGARGKRRCTRTSSAGSRGSATRCTSAPREGRSAADR